MFTTEIAVLDDAFRCILILRHFRDPLFQNYYGSRMILFHNFVKTIKDYQNFYSICNSNKIQYISKFLRDREKSFPSLDRPNHVTNRTIQTPRTQSCTRTIQVSMFHREMLYGAYSAHVNPFESAIAAEFGFKNLANSSLQLQFHPGRWEFEGWIRGKKRKGIAVEKKKKKRQPMKYAYKRMCGGTKVAEADC